MCANSSNIQANEIKHTLRNTLKHIEIPGLRTKRGSAKRWYSGTFGCGKRWVRSVRWLGNVSHSTYLLHWPLFFIILFGFPLHPDSRLFFVVVITVLLALSLASFHLFEYPAQQFLRRKLLSRLVVREPAATR